MKENETNQLLGKVLYKKRYFILAITAIFAISAIVITTFIPKKYVAYGVVYPTSSNNLTEVISNPDFGFDIHADRLIQLFNSDLMKKKIIQEFDLINYYELDTSSKGWRYSLNKNYASDIVFNRTKYLSVAIQANMKDPFMAANVVNRLIELIDTVKQDVFKTNFQVLAKDFKQKLDKQQIKIDELLLQLFEESKEGKGAQNPIAANHTKQIEERTESGKSALGDDLIKDLLSSNYTIKKEQLLNNYYHELGIYNALRNDYTGIKQSIERPFPAVYQISRAEPDEKKVSPSLFVNGILGIILGLLFSIALVVFLNRYSAIVSKYKD